MLKRLLIVILIASSGIFWWTQRSVQREPGVLVDEVPRQVTVAGVKPFLKGSSTITPLAEFQVTARVLHSKRYRFDRGAKISPYDLALGWGRMSDSSVLDRIKIAQAGRFYMWRTKEFPIPVAEITRSSSNMHIIPADVAVMSKLRRIRKGHVVTIDGYLVMVRGEDGGNWISSTRRDDSGNGACELVWAENITIH
jgi:hypothetical protein